MHFFNKHFYFVKQPLKRKNSQNRRCYFVIIVVSFECKRKRKRTVFKLNYINNEIAKMNGRSVLNDEPRQEQTVPF